jgi:hypothetical protein
VLRLDAEIAASILAAAGVHPLTGSRPLSG